MESNKLIVTSGTGVTSCLSVRLDNIANYLLNNEIDSFTIDSSSQFKQYQDFDNQDVANLIFKPVTEYSKPDYEVVPFSHGWQYGFADELQLETLHKLANDYCELSNTIISKATDYSNILGNRTAILYRGNDKALEVQRTPYHSMQHMAELSGSTQFLVQTDEEDFYDWFKERFPDTICFPDIPRIRKDPDGYVSPPQGQRVKFAMNFLAALVAISKAPKLIINTGNTGLWTLIFRGTPVGVYQYNGMTASVKTF